MTKTDEIFASQVRTHLIAFPWHKHYQYTAFYAGNKNQFTQNLTMAYRTTNKRKSNWLSNQIQQYLCNA